MFSRSLLAAIGLIQLANGPEAVRLSSLSRTLDEHPCWCRMGSRSIGRDFPKAVITALDRRVA
jgi:hypothetical protein